MNKYLKSGMVIAIGILVFTTIVQSLIVSSAYALARYFNFDAGSRTAMALCLLII